MSGISTTSGVSPAETVVANCSKAWPQGSDVISTVTPGFCASKPFTISRRVAVRSGLVMTSVSLRVWARPGLAARPVSMVAVRSVLIMPFLLLSS